MFEGFALCVSKGVATLVRGSSGVLDWAQEQRYSRSRTKNYCMITGSAMYSDGQWKHYVSEGTVDTLGKVPTLVKLIEPLSGHSY